MLIQVVAFSTERVPAVIDFRPARTPPLAPPIGLMGSPKGTASSSSLLRMENTSQVEYNSRHTCDDFIEKIRKEGDMSAMSFGQQRDPCGSFFKKVMSSFHALIARDDRGNSGVNIGVTAKANIPMPAKLTKGVASQQDPRTSQASKFGNVWLKSDNATFQEVDSTTIEPVTVATHPKLHPELKGPFTGTHSRTDPVIGDWYNYNLEIGRQAVYRVFSVSATTEKPTILATTSGGDIKAA